tara:strand:- start:624 stop:1244 length:621 start_codon:yes stop_codon:yes gene_type:complete
MIAKLKGRIDQIGDNWLVIDVNGVGYLVFCSASTLNNFSLSDSEVSLLIDTHVREDQISLYGFLNYEEKEWFRLLLSVQGVGARVALAILSVLIPNQLTEAITFQNNSAFTQVSGVGPKLAQRIVSELKDKSPKLTQQSSANETGVSENDKSSDARIKDAVSALVNLGYKEYDAFQAIAKLSKKSKMPLEELVKKGLQELSFASEQ